MSILDELDWRAVREQYDVRVEAHFKLIRLFFGKDRGAFFELAIGICDSAANYSASDHGIGARVRSENLGADQSVWELAAQFRQLDNAREVPDIISRANIKYLSIGVGSELSCLMNPEVCWVANTRTIWTHLVVKHADNFVRANEELKLYRTADVNSEMEYAAWSELHTLLEVALSRLSEEGVARAYRAGIEPGHIKYLWADAIADAVFKAHSPRTRRS